MKKSLKWIAYSVAAVAILLVLFFVLLVKGYLDFENAIREGNVTSARRFLEKDRTRINYKNREGFGALQIAVDLNHEAIVELLLQYGADIKEPNKDGSTLLHHAALQNYPGMARLLIARGLSVDSDWSGSTPLHLAASMGNLQVAKELLARGANVNSAKDEDRYETPLYEAVGYAHVEMARFLIANGADCKRRRGRVHGNTLLFSPGYAAEVNDKPRSPDIVNVLVECGLDVNERNADGDTPLHVVSGGQDGIARRLLEMGADVSARNNFDKTPLLNAGGWATKDIIDMMMARGADIDARDKFGKSALQYTAGAGTSYENDKRRAPGGFNKYSYEVVQFLLEKGANPAGALEPAVTAGNLKVVELLLAHKFYTEDKMGEKAAALYQAIEKNRPDIVEALAKGGAKLNELSGSDGAAPLHQAIRKGHLEIAKLLVSNGANVNLPDRSGEPPLHQTVKAGLCDMTLYLVEHGADLEAKDRDGRTAIQMASEEIAADLAAKGAKRPAKVENEGDRQACAAILEYANKGTLRNLVEKPPEEEADSGLYIPDMPNVIDDSFVIALNGERYVVGSNKTIPRIVWRPTADDLGQAICHFGEDPGRTSDRLYVKSKFDIAFSGMFPDDQRSRRRVPDRTTESAPDVPADLFADATVAIVSASRGESGTLGPKIESTEGAAVALTVDLPGRNVVLILNTYYPVSWNIETSPGTRIKGIVLSGGHHSSPPRHSSVSEKTGAKIYATRLPTAWEQKSTEFYGLLKQLNLWFGVKKIDYLVGTLILPKTVNISGQPAKSSYLTIDGPVVEPAKSPLEFNLHTRALQPIKWTPTGPVIKAYEKVEYLFEGKFAESPNGHEVFVVKDDKLYVLNRENGDRNYFPTPVGFPEISWVSDIAYDATRNILTIVSTVGKGVFYRFDATSKKWLDYRSAEGEDIISLAYNTVNDDYVALTKRGALLHIGPNGKEKGRTEIADKLDGVGRWSEVTQRVPRLSIYPSKTEIVFVYFETGRVAAIWIYSTISGESRLTYKAE